MIDLKNLVAPMARLTLAADFPDVDAIAQALGLDISEARLTTMKHGNLIIRSARLDEGAITLEVIAARSPRRSLYLMFENSRLPYRVIEDESFGADQRINKSRFSDEFAVAFQRDGLEFAITADSPDSVVSAIFCSEPHPRLAQTQKSAPRAGVAEPCTPSGE